MIQLKQIELYFGSLVCSSLFVFWTEQGLFGGTIVLGESGPAHGLWCPKPRGADSRGGFGPEALGVVRSGS